MWWVMRGYDSQRMAATVGTYACKDICTHLQPLCQQSCLRRFDGPTAHPMHTQCTNHAVRRNHLK